MATLATAGTLSAASPLLPFATREAATVGVEVSGTWTGTITWEVRIGTVYVNAQVFTTAGVATTATQTANGSRLINVAGFSEVRANFSTPTSGTPVVTFAGVAAAMGGSGGGGGGGGAVTIADGADVALGATADTAATTDTGTFSLIALFKRMLQKLTTGLPVAGTTASGGTVVGLNPVAVGMNGAGALLRHFTEANAAAATTGNGVVGVGPLAFDGTNYQKTAGDTSGRQIIVGAAAAGSAIAGNPVLLGASDGTNAQALLSTTGTPGSLRVSAVNSAAGSDATTNTVGYAVDQTGAARQQTVAQSIFNGATWDRQRCNVDAILLASAARTTTQTSADITTYNLSAITVWLDTTVIGTGSVTLSINGKDPASGKYILLLAGAAVTTNVTNVYTVDPALPAVANVNAQKRLPRTVQIIVTANNANSAVYSVGYCLHLG